MRDLGFVLLLWIGFGSVCLADAVADGKRIYRDGIAVSGAEVTASSVGDVSLTGRQAACVGCHRRSGLGSSEGGRLVLPVAGKALFLPGPVAPPNVHGVKPITKDMIRPPYDSKTLAVVLREGIAPNGRRLDSAMPRFKLTDEDIQALTAYLGSLDQVPPSVEPDKIHWGTVITPNADPARAETLLNVIGAYFEQHNREIESYRRHGHVPTNRGFAPLREWVLHVWHLEGPPASWPDQLSVLQASQPVFALLGGLGGLDESWRPVHEFCEAREVPCLFPNTLLPPLDSPAFYSLYFSKGLVAEAEGLAMSFDHLSLGASKRPEIHQVYRSTAAGKSAAQAFRTAWARYSKGGHLIDSVIEGAQPMSVQEWRKLAGKSGGGNWVLWLTASDLASLPADIANKHRLFLSGTLNGGRVPQALTGLKSEVSLVSPFGTPAVTEERFSRVRQWLAERGLASTDIILEGNTFWMLWMLSEAMERIGSHFSSDFLIEQFEDSTDNLRSSSLYPRVSLAPGQRFSAKGIYLLRQQDGALHLIQNDPVNP